MAGATGRTLLDQQMANYDGAVATCSGVVASPRILPPLAWPNPERYLSDAYYYRFNGGALQGYGRCRVGLIYCGGALSGYAWYDLYSNSGAQWTLGVNDGGYLYSAAAVTESMAVSPSPAGLLFNGFLCPWTS